MTDDRQDAAREGDDRRSGGPIGTVLGATLGPFGAAVGGVVDENRFAVTLSVGTGATGERDDEATTIEIGNVGPEATGESDADESGANGAADTESADEDGE
jgi:hypothetical protein